MIGLGLALATARPGSPGPAPAPVSALFLGQSEMDYLFNTGSAYRQVPQPVPGTGNLTVVTQSGFGAAPVTTVVTPASVAAGLVNPAMAALSAFLAFAVPGRRFVVGDGAVPGTGRNDLADDATDGTDDRRWLDLKAVVDLVEAETGQPLQSVVEMWFANDAGSFGSFFEAFSPFYFGTLSNGATYPLGSVHTTGRRIDHCLWDASVTATEKGRGLFARSATAWRMLGLWPRWSGVATAPAELASYADQANNVVQPMREIMRGWVNHPLAQSVSLRAGPSAHLCKFGGASTSIHPDTGNPDGQVLAVWPFAVELLRLAGRPLAEPEIVGIEGPEDGTHADLLVSLPNGGTLTTLRALRGLAAPAAPLPQQQAVTGVEILRGASRRPVFRTDAGGYPASHRGTVAVQAGAETHATYGRVGRVRITPAQPFAFGNALSYLMGSAIAGLKDTDIGAGLYLDMLLEHIPALHDPGAAYPFPGVAVRPYQQDATVAVPAPAFTARSALFNGASFYTSSAILVPAADRGLLSLWFRNADATWNTPSRTLFSFQVGTTATLALNTTSSGRLTLRLNNSGTPDTAVFHAAPGNTPFLTNRWYHLMAGWTAGGALVVQVDGVQVATLDLTGRTLDQQGQNLTRIGIGATTTGSQIWTGEIGHLWLSVTQTLDLSLAANREKFRLAGAPVNLGGAGDLVTGTPPEWYYDGAAGDWNNKGTAGNVALTGVLTAGGVPGA
jgi:hypothetical protein